MITQAELKEIINYCPDCGTFMRKDRRKPSFVGFLCPNKYVAFSLKGKRLYAHQWAFLYMTGSIPKEIDHINNIESDNRWSNLRSTTSSQNKANTRTRKTKHSRGVYFVPKVNKSKPWQVKVGSKHIGYFASKDEAVEAHKTAHIEMFGEYSHLSSLS